MGVLAFSGSVYGKVKKLPLEQQSQYAKFAQDSLYGETGTVYFSDAHCNITVPEGMVFLDHDDTEKLLRAYWGNPKNSADGVFGSLVNKDDGIFFNVETAYIISYEDVGYVSDKDAVSIDYDSLLKDMQKDTREANKKNPQGVQWELLGWGWSPSYDSQRKVLSWSRHLLANEQDEIINYDVRILGKAGFVVITAVADPSSKDDLLAANNSIISSISYDNGFRYEDFDPKNDHIAEWTIGGLIAGKVLAKAGFWALLGKFSKILVFAIIGFFAVLWKRIKRWLGFGVNDEDDSYLEPQS